jgi:hypothetical protein
MKEVELSFLNTTLTAPQVLRALAGMAQAQKNEVTFLDLTDSGITYGSCKDFAARLLEFPNLTTLWIRNCKLGDGIREIASVINKLSCLKTIIFRDIGLSAVGLTALCVALRTNTSVEKLDISWHASTAEGLNAIIEMLGINMTLKYLVMEHSWLERNPIQVGQLLVFLQKKGTRHFELDTSAGNHLPSDMSSRFFELRIAAKVDDSVDHLTESLHV